MQTWDLSYGLGNGVPDKMNGKTKAAIAADMFFRHTIWAVEILPHKNFYIIASYNHRRQKEMAIKDKRSIAGFALGAGGSRGVAHIGFLQAMEEEGIKPDLITGCSMGAIVGSVVGSVVVSVVGSVSCASVVPEVASVIISE